MKMSRKLKIAGIGAAAALSAMTATAALAAEPTSICDSEATSFDMWVIQLFTCR